MVACMQERRDVRAQEHKSIRAQGNKNIGTVMPLHCVLSAWFAFMFILVVSGGYCPAQDTSAASLPSGRKDAEQMRIGNIETAGNVTISRVKILSTVRAKVGELFNAASAAEDAGRIARIEGVRRAYYNTEVVENQVKLTFVVVEKNLVRLLAFKGNKEISSGKLAKELAFKRGDYLDLFLVRSGLEKLTELYHKRGHALVEIGFDEAGLAVGEVVYNIEEGPRVRIKETEFAGNKSIESKELKKAIKTRTRKFLFWPVYYDGQVLFEDVAKLSRVYQEKGFLDARVDVSSRFSDDGQSAYVTFTIEEGPIYTIERTIIRGNKFFDEEALSKDMKLKVGQFYSKEKGDRDVRHILRRYLERGFVDVNVGHRHSFPAAGKVAVEFEITEGEQFRIGRVIITGNESTHDKVIRRVMDEEDFSPGQWYNADVARGDGTGELEKTIQRLVMSESMFIRSAGTKPGQRDAHVSIIEGQTGSVMLGAGFASDSGMIGHLVFDQRNFDITDWPESFRELITGKAFKGAGQRLRIALEPGTVQDVFSISFTEPYLFDKPVSLDVVGSSFERRREAYDEERLKGYLGFEKRYKDKWRRGISFRAETVDVARLDSDAPTEIREVKGSNDLYGIRLYIRKDTTDIRFNPSSGYHFNAGYEQVGGDHTFGILSGTQRWYRTLYQDLADRKTILEVKLHGATVVGDAPPFEKFYAGGTSSLRGFDYRGVSTRGLQSGPGVVNPERKDPIGSDWILLANAEVAVPLTEEVVSALFFVDAGTIDSGGVRASVGIGLQILIPQWFGPVPMRFELATPFMKDDDDETRVFSFSVGALF